MNFILGMGLTRAQQGHGSEAGSLRRRNHHFINLELGDYLQLAITDRGSWDSFKAGSRGARNRGMAHG